MILLIFPSSVRVCVGVYSRVNSRGQAAGAGATDHDMAGTANAAAEKAVDDSVDVARAAEIQIHRLAPICRALSKL